MNIIRRNELHRGGFAGLRETRLVMNPSVFGRHREPGTSAGIGRFVYLADARFLPRGDTRMHSHQDVDVISIMVEGRVRHEGSLESGQELPVGHVQVQRSGAQGFSHNEINPDDSKNRMLQLWLLPEESEQDASYQLLEIGGSGRTRIYGGTANEPDTVTARTVVDIVRLGASEAVEQPGISLAYVVTGAGAGLGETLREGDLVESLDFSFQASTESELILVYGI
jgi:redox-sensitive bicupin YhaK (pirin superfamily)